MFEAITRKTRQVVSDPVLRQWMVGRLIHSYPKEAAFKAHHPPYLDSLLPLSPEKPTSRLSTCANTPPSQPIRLPLAGQTVTLQPGEEQLLFQRTFPDPETTLSLHRFAWLPLLGDTADPAWVNAIWRIWQQQSGQVQDNWAWQPYTASERAINILAFSKRHDLPGQKNDTLDMLAKHAPAIADRLEYFGDHHTSNHLANNGRGLFLLGLELGMPRCTELGGRILVEEARRIFSESGILREGSSHYHALLTHNYFQAAQAAQQHNRPEAKPLLEIVHKMCAVLNYLKLPGGIPLIGDISPDDPPSNLFRQTDELIASAAPVDEAALSKDGWLRFDQGPWSGLWHAAPEGWSHMPGHGHQDCGSFELHYEGIPLFIDPGRGHYGEHGEAMRYRSARVHNSLIVDGADPYPPNKPYYSDDFRRKIGGAPPQLSKTRTSVRLVQHGFSRLHGIAAHERQWHFDNGRLTLTDRLNGRGKHALVRTLCTSQAIEESREGLILRTARKSFLLRSEKGKARLETSLRWTAYGVSEPATFIHFETKERLDWQGQLILDVLEI